jgi:hypothetical protein
MARNYPPTDCNKPKSYKLPPLATPTPIEGYPLNPSPPAEIPDYGDMGRVQAIRRRQWEVGRRAPMKPIGEPTLRKRDSVSRRRDGEEHQ